MSALVRDAYRFAAHAHEGQEKDGEPYIDHVLAVARLLADAGYDDEVVAAALLHDVAEHSDVPLDELRERFGAGVAELVAAMTEPEGIEPWERRKRAHSRRVALAGRRAGAIFAADKAANAASMRRALARQRDVERVDGKVRHYRSALAMVPSTDPVATRLRDELDRLAAERKRPHVPAPSSSSHQPLSGP